MAIHGKKGDVQELWYRLIAVALVLFFAAGWMLLYNDVKDNTLFFKNFYSKDIALTADTMHAAQGDIALDYDFKRTSKPLRMNIRNGTVSFYDYSDRGNNTIPINFQYGEAPSVAADYSGKVETRMQLVKEGAKIKVKEAVPNG